MFTTSSSLSNTAKENIEARDRKMKKSPAHADRERPKNIVRHGSPLRRVSPQHNKMKNIEARDPEMKNGSRNETPGGKRDFGRENSVRTPPSYALHLLLHGTIFRPEPRSHAFGHNRRMSGIECVVGRPIVRGRFFRARTWGGRVRTAEGTSPRSWPPRELSNGHGVASVGPRTPT